MSNYFAGVTDIETLRKRYRELLKKYHPDNGGSVSVNKESVVYHWKYKMDEINITEVSAV